MSSVSIDIYLEPNDLFEIGPSGNDLILRCPVCLSEGEITSYVWLAQSDEIRLFAKPDNSTGNELLFRGESCEHFFWLVFSFHKGQVLLHCESTIIPITFSSPLGVNNG